MKIRKLKPWQQSLMGIGLGLLTSAAVTPPASAVSLSQAPLYLTVSTPPLVLLTMARDHKLYYEAYNDYSDLNGDGQIDTGYKPAIEYYGYFDSYKCYAYENDIFVPKAMSDSSGTDGSGNPIYNKKCTGGGRDYWSGDFLNYLTTSRMDALRKVFYGGYRSTDTSTQTILERAFIPQDAHAWGKEYESVARDGYDIQEYSPLGLPSTGNRHLFASVTLTSDTSPPLLRVRKDSNKRIWEWLSKERPVADNSVNGGTAPGNSTCGSGDTFFECRVRVEVCKEISGLGAFENFGREANCQSYGGVTPVYKPTGLLHKYAGYGTTDNMYFSLLTGSYDQYTEGGILRKKMGSVTDEIELDTGIFKESGATCGRDGATTCVKGIVGTINRLRIIGFSYADQSYGCGWTTGGETNRGNCNMWGNPVAEMMYEGLRYFSGRSAAKSEFTTSSTNDDAIGLPRITSWTHGADANMFSATVPTPAGKLPRCSKPYFMVVSDVYPSFDSNALPGNDTNFGSAWTGSGSFNSNTLNVSTYGQNIWNNEFGASASKSVFIGQSGATSDETPSPKTATSFGSIRGLAPAEPTRQGSYYSASVAYFSKINDINAVSGTQKIGTYSLALSAPLPNIEIPVGTSKITILPFAKSPGGCMIATRKPTNQIVDFYVDTIKNTTTTQCSNAGYTPASTDNCDIAVNGGRPYYKFRINFEDVEEGADHDMDAIAEYTIALKTDNTVDVQVDSTYAAGCIIQHMGYVISGTGVTDGTYLVVRDLDTAAGDDVDYSLDYPATAGALPTTSTRNFTPSTTGSTATFLKDPLWYAAKYGGFDDANGNNIPDSTEWDADNNGTPDNYFLVVNPLKMLEQMDKALSRIKDDSGTSAALSTNSFSFQTDTLLFQTRFNSDGWAGELNAYPVTAAGINSASWQAQKVLANKSANSRVIITYDPHKSSARGIPFRWASVYPGSAGTSFVNMTRLGDSLNRTVAGTSDSLGSDRLNYLRGAPDNTMRTRPIIPGTTLTNKLGDVVNSQAQYVARPNFGYGKSGYAIFSNNNANRTKMVYVGANDGMLHGFRATDGEEMLAYVPSEMFRYRDGSSTWPHTKPMLSKLTQSDYGKTANPHRYFVDGSPTIGDICTETYTDATDSCNSASDWKTILVGGLNAGGQGIYALDVTDPGTFSEAGSNPETVGKWEFLDYDYQSGTDVRGDSDLGYTYSRPFIVRLCTDRSTGSSPAFPGTKTCEGSQFFVVFGSGYNSREDDGSQSTYGKAALFVVDANTGLLKKKITVNSPGVSSTTVEDNGLAELAPIDADGDGVVDWIYAGDLKGNVWRFNFSDDSTNNWEAAFSGNPLYTAKDSGGTVQPVTTAPDAVVHPEGGLIVIFGTGKYLESGTTDTGSTQVQTVYGIWDNNAAVTTYDDRNNLQQQEVFTTTVSATSTTTLSGGVTVSSAHDYRTVSTNSVTWTGIGSKKGWYLNLPDTGERIAFNPESRAGSVLKFTSTVPSSDICDAGGYSWDYYIDPTTGGRLNWSAFVDLTGEQTFGAVTGYASARKSTIGITPPGTLITEGQGRGMVFQGGSTGEMDYYKANLGQSTAGRVSWREILSD